MEESKPTQNSIEKSDSSSEKALESLTDQNWLFINHYLNGASVKKAYQLAGYSGKDASAPYQLFKQLKARIEHLGDLDVTSRARLQSEIARLLDLPLSDDKKSVSFSEKLRLLKFIGALTPEATQQKPQISVLVINRPEKKQPEIKVSESTTGKHVIDAQLVDEE